MRYWNSIAFMETDQLVEVAQIAEELGFHGVTWADHLVTPATIKSPYPYSPDGYIWWDPRTEFPEPMTMTAVLARETTDLHFMSYTYILPMRDVFTAAKAISTAAYVADGRMELGVAVGWLKEEFDLTGQRFDDRGKRTDEMLEVLDLLMSGDMVEHHGRFYDFPPVQMRPVPSQRVPVYVGGYSDAALARAARNDGWLGVYNTPDHIAESVARLARFREQHGSLDRDDFEVLVALVEPVDVDEHKRLRDLGVTSILNCPWLEGVDPSPVSAKRAKLEQYAERYISAMGS
jgi:probable F420-dependent oxidoreductase